MVKQPNTWIDYSFRSLHGLPMLFYQFLQLIRFISFGADPARAWLVLNTIGLILSGFTAILGFWISNTVVLGLNYLLISVMLKQFGLEEVDFPESKSNTITFIPAQGNVNFWHKERDITLHKSQNGNSNILFAVPDYEFRTINKRRHLIDAPRIDDDSLSGVKIFNGRSFVDEIDSGKITTYNRSVLKEVKQWIDYNENVVVFIPKKSLRGEPLLLKCNPYYLLDGLSASFSDSSPFVSKMRDAVRSWEKDDDLW